MNAPLIFRLVGLRYKLLWAQTRTRNGRIALFLTGYLFALLILMLMTAGGFGAAMLAVRSGHAEKVAQAVLGGLFVQCAAWHPWSPGSASTPPSPTRRCAGMRSAPANAWPRAT